jgi:hypothetical protein
MSLNGSLGIAHGEKEGDQDEIMDLAIGCLPPGTEEKIHEIKVMTSMNRPWTGDGRWDRQGA